MNTDQMRKDFEKWYSDDGVWPETTARTGAGYVYMGADAAWRAWQAALATQPQAPQGGDIVEYIARQWDGCMCDIAAVGEVDIGAAIRSDWNEYSRLAPTETPEGKK